MRILCFIKQSCKDFCDPFVSIIHNCFLVHSNLEYCPLIWINNMSKQNDSIESAQNNFFDLCLLNVKYISRCMVHMIIF
jgi:hypothetical protein